MAFANQSKTNQATRCGVTVGRSLPESNVVFTHMQITGEMRGPQMAFTWEKFSTSKRPTTVPIMSRDDCLWITVSPLWTLMWPQFLDTTSLKTMGNCDTCTHRFAPIHVCLSVCLIWGEMLHRRCQQYIIFSRVQLKFLLNLLGVSLMQKMSVQMLSMKHAWDPIPWMSRIQNQESRIL